eukprot:353485-Prymnesium_polylepis.2
MLPHPSPQVPCCGRVYGGGGLCLHSWACCTSQGCRHLEIDCWDGFRGIPVVKHGGTFCTVERFDAVAAAVAECAFLTFELPVMLSLELPLDPFLRPRRRQMHCTPKQQHWLASNVIHHIGDALLKVRARSSRFCVAHAYDELVTTGQAMFQSPQDLKRRVMLKGKVKQAKVAKLPARSKSTSSLVFDRMAMLQKSSSCMSRSALDPTGRSGRALALKSRLSASRFSSFSAHFRSRSSSTLSQLSSSKLGHFLGSAAGAARLVQLLRTSKSSDVSGDARGVEQRLSKILRKQSSHYSNDYATFQEQLVKPPHEQRHKCGARVLEWTRPAHSSPRAM